jgi:hypothetical protein
MGAYDFGGEELDAMLAMQSGWKKRRYYAEDGYLKPVPGSRVEDYDPFIASPLPYLELAALDTADERAVEAFASRFGLLGLFQERLHNTRNVFQVMADAQGLTELSKQFQTQTPGYFLDYLPGLRGAPLERINEVIYGNELGEHLAEPLDEFRTAADEFRAMYEVAAMAEGRMSVEEAEWLKQRFNSHRRRVWQVADYTLAGDGATVGGWSRAWAFPSLLSACYQQMLLNLTNGRDLRICKNEKCRKPFETKHKKHYYCDPDCGNAQEQRERRRRRSAA